MKKVLLLSLASGGLFGLAGCETTGDPNSGGIFWSERKAQQRLADRQAVLNSTDRDTARVERQNGNLESAAARKRRLLEQQ